MANNRVIFKYVITDLSESAFEPCPLVKMPYGARIVAIDVQRSILCVWAEIDPVASMVEREFVIVGTGQPIPTEAFHLHTFQIMGGDIVLHLYLKHANHNDAISNHHDQPAGATAN